MVKYLYLNGSTDHLRSPVVSVDKIVMDFTFELNNPPSTLAYYLFDNRGGTPSGNYMVYVNTAGTLLSKGTNIALLKLNGIEGNTFTVAPNTRYLVEAAGVIVTSNSNGIEFFLNYAEQATSRTKGKLYRVTGYSGTNVIFDYDTSTGTVQDQSGNGKHGTLTGGTWLDDGTGVTPTATPETVAFATKQQMYASDSAAFATRQQVYEGETASFSTKQIIEEVSSQETVTFTTKQVITAQETANFSTKQILFSSDTSTFGTYLKIFQQETVEFAMEQIIDKGIPTPETVHFPIRVYINNFIVIEHDITGERFMKNSMPVNDSPDYVIPKGFHLSADQTHVPFIGKVTKWEANSKDPINTMQRWY